MSLKQNWASGETFTAADANAVATAVNATPAAVVVTAGSETRPDAAVVLWIETRGEEATRPTNMDDDTDLWFTPNGSSGGGGDTTAPSVPTGLASSNVADTSFDVSWSASTDDVAVTGYEVRLDAGTAVVPTGLSHSFTGLTAETDYDVDVRARDAAANWSAWCTPITVTTEPEATVPSPTVRYNFNEGSGTTATSVAGGHTMTDQSGGSPVWGSGTIQTEMRGYLNGVSTGTESDWSLAVDAVFSGAPGSEKTLFAHQPSQFLNLQNDGKVKWYGASTVTSASGIAFSGTKRVVLSQTATTLKIYVDGVEFISSTQANAYDTAQQSNVLLGGMPNAAVDSLRLWLGTALDASQVAALGA